MAWDDDAYYETELEIPSGRWGKLVAIPGGPGPTGPAGPQGEPGPAGPPGPAEGVEFVKNKGVPNGYAPLDSAGLVPTQHLPALAVFNVRDFGAVGDGVTDDTASVQAAYDYVASVIGTPGQFGGGTYATLLFPKGKYKLTGGLNAWHPLINLRGEGGVIIGQFFVGRATYESDQWNLYRGTAISGLTFDLNDSYGTTTCIRLANVRGLTIRDCYFFRAGSGIVASYVDGNTGQHVVGMIRVVDCHFAGLKYGVYTDTINWMVCSDWHIRGCYFNFCSETSLWMWCSNGKNVGGVDGLLFTENTVFSQVWGHSRFTEKQHNIKVGTSNVVIISNNNLFESGRSAIYLADPANVTITGNQFWYPGQVEQADCIEFHGIGVNAAVAGSISDNSFNNWTRDAISFHDISAANLLISANSYKWQANPPTWHGTGSVDKTNCHRIYQKPTVIAQALDAKDSAELAREEAVTEEGNLALSGAATLIERLAGPLDGSPKVQEPGAAESSVGDSIRGTSLMTARYPTSDIAGVSGSRSTSTAVTAATNIFTVADLTGSLTGPFGGLVSVTAKNTGGGNGATYLMFIEGSSPSAASLTMLASSGMLAGTNANWPSFTWSISGNDLTATPFGATSGNFDFHAVAIGAITLG